MTDTIEANTLRDWLEAHDPVVVLDVRSDEDRAQWTIPGSVHINAYEALRAGQPGALASAILPHDRPVVTVCNAGHVSQRAAAIQVLSRDVIRCLQRVRSVRTSCAACRQGTGRRRRR